MFQASRHRCLPNLCQTTQADDAAVQPRPASPPLWKRINAAAAAINLWKWKLILDSAQSKMEKMHIQWPSGSQRFDNYWFCLDQNMLFPFLAFQFQRLLITFTCWHIFICHVCLQMVAFFYWKCWNLTQSLSWNEPELAGSKQDNKRSIYWGPIFYFLLKMWPKELLIVWLVWVKSGHWQAACGWNQNVCD